MTTETPRAPRWIIDLRVILLVLIVIGLILLATQKLWTPRLIAIAELYAVRHDSALNLRVDDRALEPATATGLGYSFQTVTFNVPWQTLGGRSGNGTTVLSLYFNSGTSTPKVIIQTEFPLTENRTSQNALLQKAHGELFATNYDLYRAAMNTVPHDINIASPSTNFVPKMPLLLLKQVLLPEDTSYLYGFTTPKGMRGFQSELSATSTDVVFFTPNDTEYTMLISNASQAQVDSILQSVQEK